VRLHEVGAGAVLVELGDVDEVWAWHAALVAGRDGGRLPAVEEIVPGARTVLLDGVESPPAVVAELATWEVARGEEPAPGPLVEIATVYDGEDLPWVAEQWGVDVEGAVAEHSGTDLRAAFCGFAPGFAYLVGLPPQRHLPRRDTPRPRVPAGAVAVAGEYTAIYPTASPGGWHLIGRTDAVLWDPDRPRPALIAPGDRVRFVPVGP
jgi:KipI family sensor histidine kinase inhibitor